MDQEANRDPGPQDDEVSGQGGKMWDDRKVGTQTNDCWTKL
jgi:hypothetical protein